MVVRVISVGQPTRQVSAVDILIQALGLTGLLLVGSAVLGGVLGGLFILFKSRRPLNRLNGEAAAQDGLHLST